MFSRFAVALRLLCFVAMGLLVQVPMIGSAPPLQSREHPRIWLTVGNIPEYRTKLSGALRSEYQQFITFLDNSYATAGSDTEYYYFMRNYAFVYAVGPVPGITYGRTINEYGLKAVELLRTLANTQTAAEGGVLHTAAVTYDWCYALLTPADRIRAVALLKSAPQPAGPGGNRSAFHHYELYWRYGYLLGALAFANDGIDDAEAAARLSKYEEYITGDGGALPAKNFITASDGGVSVGMSYAVNGTSDSIVVGAVQLAEAWRTATGLTRQAVFAGDNELRFFPQWVAYSIMPAKTPGGYKIFYPTHQMDRGRTTVGFADMPVTLSALRLYRDIDPNMAGLAQWLLADDLIGPVPTSGVVGKRSAVLGNFVFNPGGVTPQSPTSLRLPLSKLFRGIGWLVMRTGWTSPNDSVVTFIASPYTRKPAYANVDHGSFTVDRNGPLVIHAGTGAHHAFEESTRAHNTMTFTDPNEPVGSWPEYWDMGGQRGLFNIPAGLSQITRQSEWDIGGILRNDLYDGSAAHDYDYAYSDLTRAYNGPANSESYNTSKVKRFSRQFVHFRRATPDGPDQIVVFDRTETVSIAFEKRWMLHPPGRADGQRSFAVTGYSSQAVGPVRNGSSEGKRTYTQPDLITITNTDNGSNGRLFWKPLLPVNRVVVEVGGPDSTGKYVTAGSHEFEDGYGKQQIEGGNYAPSIAQYVGQYSLELQPASRGNVYEVFLNVMEATVPSQSTMTTATLVNGSRTVGAAIGQRMAVFNRSEGYFDSDTLTVPNAGSYRILFCDLQPGMNYIINGTTVAAGPAGTAYVSVAVQAGGSLSIAATGTMSEPPTGGTRPAAPTGLRLLGP